MPTTIRAALIATALLFALAPRAGAVTAEDVDALVAAEVARRMIPGCSVAVVKDGALVLAKGYGEANVELHVPATPSTVYQIGSLTKQFTSALVLQLAGEGKLSLDDAVGKHVTSLPEAWRKVTVRQLLQHVGGIPSYTGVPGFGDVPCKDYTTEELVALVADKPLEFEPGTKWAYSNSGYYILGLVVEKASGMPYCDVARERIFSPLGMTATRCNDLTDVVPGRAAGYTLGDGGSIANAAPVSPTQPFAAGVLISSVEDMAKWDAALEAGKVMSRESLEAAWTPGKLADGSVTGYGFGWSVASPNGHRLVAHDGGIPGFASSIQRWLDEKLTVIVLANSNAASAGLVARAVAGLYMPDLKEPDPVPDQDPVLTARLKGLLVAAAEGTLKPEEFTTEAAAALFPDLVKQAQVMLQGFGALQSLALLERRGGGVEPLVLRYRATFDKVQLGAIFAVMSDGKIATMRLVPI